MRENKRKQRKEKEREKKTDIARSKNWERKAKREEK
jgi:hypothetical protein